MDFRKLIIFILLFNQAVASDLNRIGESLIDSLGVHQFYVDMRLINEIKTVDYVSPRAFSANKFKEYWPFWKRFNGRQFRAELKDKILIEFNQEELELATSVFSRFFYGKVVKSLLDYSDYISIYNQLLLGHEELIFSTDSRKILVERIYDYTGLKILEKNLIYRMSLLTRIGSKFVKIANLKTNKEFYYIPVDFENHKKLVKKLIFYMINNNLRNYSDHEINVFLKDLNNQSIRKFIQFFVNYHYLYLTDFIMNHEVSLGLITQVDKR